MKEQKSFKLVALLLSVFIFTQITGVAFASSNNQDNKLNIDKQKAISSHDKYVSKNIHSFLSNKRDKTSDKKIYLQGNEGKKYEIPLYSVNTSDLYDDNGKSLDITAVTYGYEITNNDLVATGGGSFYKYGDDTSYSVEGYITVYYTYDTVNGADLYTVTSASGGYTVLDHTVSIESQEVVFVEVGVGQNGSPVVKQAYAYPTTSSWSAYSNFTVPIIHAGTYQFGASYRINLKHGTSSFWTLTIEAQF